MAFLAKLIDVQREGVKLTLYIEYRDETTGWTQTDAIPFARGDTLTWADAQLRVREIGAGYKASIARETTLRANVGDELTV
jgi:hypothetical protein